MGVYVDLKTKDGKDYKFPKIVYYQLQEFKNRIDNNLDAHIIITGSVGSGKSNLEIGIGGTWEEVLFNRDFGLDHIHFDTEKVIQETNRNDNFKEFIGFDETIQGGSSRDSISRIGKMFRQTLVSKRFKGHLVVYCVDSLKELTDKIIERSVIWYHVHYRRLPSGRYEKGLFKVFNTQQALRVYEDLKDKKYFRAEDHPIWKKERYIFNSNNYMGLWFDEEEYNDKKSTETNLLDIDDERFEIEGVLMGMLHHEHKVKQGDIGKRVGKSQQIVSNRIKTYYKQEDT